MEGLVQAHGMLFNHLNALTQDVALAVHKFRKRLKTRFLCDLIKSQNDLWAFKLKQDFPVRETMEHVTVPNEPKSLLWDRHNAPARLTCPRYRKSIESPESLPRGLVFPGPVSKIHNFAFVVLQPHMHTMRFWRERPFSYKTAGLLQSQLETLKTAKLQLQMSNTSQRTYFYFWLLPRAIFIEQCQIKWLPFFPAFHQQPSPKWFDQRKSWYLCALSLIPCCTRVWERNSNSPSSFTYIARLPSFRIHRNTNQTNDA